MPPRFLRNSHQALLIILSLLLSCSLLQAQKGNSNSAIFSGLPWFDNKGVVVSAHAACIVKDNNRYYLFGERHSDTSNAFAGFHCYSSKDLNHWKFESIALPVQDSGKLGPNRVGERAKVMKSPSTGEYIMYMHVDTLGYKDQFVGYATARKITGPYTFRGPLLFRGKPIRKWDMGTFQDSDGSGYVLIHGGEIYKLSDDYKSVTEQVQKSITSGFESPALFRKDSLYYFLGSHLTSWERNDNYYYTATSLKGPWTFRGLFAPEGSLTWNSQTTFIIPIEGSRDTTYLFMGDRWSFPKQASAATYVWQPLLVSGHKLSIPHYSEVWTVNSVTGEHKSATLDWMTITHDNQKQVQYKGLWSDSARLKRSDERLASMTTRFVGRQVGLYAQSGPQGGYAQVTLQNSKGKMILSSVIDMYCRYPVTSLKFLSPSLPRGAYTLTLTVLGEKSNWSDKKKTAYGSTGYFVSVDRILVRQ